MLSRKGIILLLAALTASFASPLLAATETNPVYDHAFNALYNLDFSIAEHDFDSLITQDESNPDYWTGKASTMLTKILFLQQKFNTESFSGGTIGAKGSKDAVDPLDEKKLRNCAETAIQKANAVLDKNPNEVHALYSLGVANATLAAFEGLARHSYLAAHSRAKEARRLHQKVLDLDPNFVDARLSIGIYDYGVGIIPRKWKFVLGMFGISGNKDEGIQDLEQVAVKGNRAATDAKMFLIVVYERESRLDEALRLIDELHSRYPRNFQFEMAKATVFRKMKRWDEADQVYGQIISEIAAKQNGYERMRAERVYYERGKSNAVGLKPNDAVAAFNHVVSSNNSSPNEKADSFVWMGRIFDSQNDRTKAVAQYQSVLSLDCDAEYKDAAQAYLKKPFK
jgi:tetratricopeptide (TPR) repeat protein